MLTFSFKLDSDTGKTNYLIKEDVMSFVDTKTKYIEYTGDLSKKRVNTDPWREVTQSDFEWFEKHHKPKFDRIIEEAIKRDLSKFDGRACRNKVYFSEV